MTESRGELDMYSDWFSQADLDKDGVLSGPEAVQFFMRSGLPQHPTLFKVGGSAWSCSHDLLGHAVPGLARAGVGRVPGRP